MSRGGDVVLFYGSYQPNSALYSLGTGGFRSGIHFGNFRDGNFPGEMKREMKDAD